jgi:hypothetical protein
LVGAKEDATRTIETAAGESCEDAQIAHLHLSRVAGSVTVLTAGPDQEDQVRQRSLLSTHRHETLVLCACSRHAECSEHPFPRLLWAELSPSSEIGSRQTRLPKEAGTLDEISGSTRAVGSSSGPAWQASVLGGFARVLAVLVRLDWERGTKLAQGVGKQENE